MESGYSSSFAKAVARLIVVCWFDANRFCLTPPLMRGRFFLLTPYQMSNFEV